MSVPRKCTLILNYDILEGFYFGGFMSPSIIAVPCWRCSIIYVCHSLFLLSDVDAYFIQHDV